MENCSRQCIRRTLYAVMIGISPMVLCLLLIALARLILSRLEVIYNRRQKPRDRRSSSYFHPPGRPTLSYTPVSTAELQRIIHGDLSSHRPSESPSDDHASSKGQKSMISMLTRRDLLPPPSTGTLANLVIRRDALDSTPLTALLAPKSAPVTPAVGTIHEQGARRSNFTTIRRESIETTRISRTPWGPYSMFGSYPSDARLTDSFLSASNTRPTVLVEEYLEFHSTSSIPCSLHSANSIVETDD